MVSVSDIKILAQKWASFSQEVREHLHQYPELSFEENETAAFVASKLNEIGVSYQKNIAGNGLVAIIEGKEPASKCIALRSDLDALPITEISTKQYASKNKGVMHACGHDMHSACLLGALGILNETKDSWTGTVKAIFQPAEEKLPGGASLMIKEGVLSNPVVDKIVAQHVFPELEAGKVGFRPGMYMASCDEIYITIHGKGGHGAMPHQCIDPVYVGSQLVVEIQHIMSRFLDPTIPGVITFGKFIAEGATNVIPSKVEMAGTFRMLNEEWRTKIHAKIKQLVDGIALSSGAKIDLNIIKGYPYLENDVALTNTLKNHAQTYLGEEMVIDLPIRMTGEDFAFYTHQVPGCFYRLGVRNEEKGIVHPVHHAQFDVDEKAYETGVGLMAWLAIHGN